MIRSRAVTGGGAGDVGFPLVTFVVVTPGLPAGVVVGGVTAGSCASDFACGSGPPVGGVCATGGLAKRLGEAASRSGFNTTPILLYIYLFLSTL